MKEQDEDLLRKAFLSGMAEGTAAVPVMLLKHYRSLKLSDGEAMLLVHLLSFTEKEQKPFPTIEEIQARMSAPPDKVITALQKLLKNDFIRIEEERDPISGILTEKYNLTPLYVKIAERAASELSKQLDAEVQSRPRLADRNDIFSVFEQEFGRPLSPMELESITGWLDKDRYSEELVRMALKEAVFAGKVHFRYIDRILLDWRRNRITNTEQAREHAKQFRGAR